MKEASPSFQLRAHKWRRFRPIMAAIVKLLMTVDRGTGGGGRWAHKEIESAQWDRFMRPIPAVCASLDYTAIKYNVLTIATIASRYTFHEQVYISGGRRGSRLMT